MSRDRFEPMATHQRPAGLAGTFIDFHGVSLMNGFELRGVQPVVTVHLVPDDLRSTRPDFSLPSKIHSSKIISADELKIQASDIQRNVTSALKRDGGVFREFQADLFNVTDVGFRGISHIRRDDAAFDSPFDGPTRESTEGSRQQAADSPLLRRIHLGLLLIQVVEQDRAVGMMYRTITSIRR
jgi:hypothetical protein